MMRRLLVSGLFAWAAFAQTYATNGDERLAAYVEEALGRHPALEESLAQYRAALQRVPQVKALPEPELGITQFIRTPETRVGPHTTTVTISQRFPWFGKLAEKGKVAAKAAAAVRERHELTKAEVVRQVKLAYYELGYVDRATAIAGQEQVLLEHFERLAQARYTQGVGLQQAVVKLQAEITRIQNRLQQLRQQRVDAEAAVNTLRDRLPETAVPAVRFELRTAAVGELDAMYETGRRNRPEVKASLLEIETNEKRIHAARKQYRPDVTIGAGFRNINGRSDPAGRLAPPPDNGKNVYQVAVGLTLPIRRRKYDAAVLEATEGFLAAKQGYRRTENLVEGGIRAAAFRLQTLEEQISLFQKVLLPQSEHAMRSTEAAYATGSITVLDLLDSERTLLEVRLGLARLEADYMKALAEMERAIGSAFPEAAP